MRRQEELKIVLRKLIEDRLAGKFPSRRLGYHGLEFSHSRPFAAGDDLNAIDWPRSFQEQRYFASLYKENKSATIVFILDQSKSMDFGTSKNSKSDLQFSLVSFLTVALSYGNNRIGFIFFSAAVNSYWPPRIGVDVNSVFHDLESDEVSQRATDINAPLQLIADLNLNPSLIFVISDFLADENGGYRQKLSSIALKHDVIPLVIKDKREEKIPKIRGYVVLRDMESGHCFYANSVTPINHRQVFDEIGLDWAEFYAEDNDRFLDKLIDFFMEKERKLHK